MNVTGATFRCQRCVHSAVRTLGHTHNKLSIAMVVATVRHICIDVKEPTSNSFDWPDTVRYAVWQTERSSSGALHVLGYVEFNKPVSFRAISNIVGEAAHLEQRSGTREQARGNCMKEESREDGPWEHGTWLAGNRTDIDTVLEAFNEGKSKSWMRTLWSGRGITK